MVVFYCFPNASPWGLWYTSRTVYLWDERLFLCKSKGEGQKCAPFLERN